MFGITDLKTGRKIVLDGEPYEVLSYEQTKMGRGGSIVRTKLKNLADGTVVDKTFQGAEKIEEADMSKKNAQFLYSDDGEAYFMDLETFEQFSLPLKSLGNKLDYLKENAEVEIVYFDNKPINIELPIKMKFKVIESPPAIKGNSASAVTKKVKIETGARVDVPVFIKKDDIIIVDTRDGSYVSRA